MGDISVMIEFAKAFDGLGWSVQAQVEDLLNGDPTTDINPNAVDLIEERLLPTLDPISNAEEYETLAEAISTFRENYAKDAEEVELAGRL